MSTIMGTRDQILRYLAKLSAGESSSYTNPSGLGWITFSSYNPSYQVTCLLGDGSPTVTGGYAGWTTVPRERLVSLVEWHGVDPLTIEIPLMMDNYAIGESIEEDIIKFEKMAGLGLTSKASQPPLLTFNSGGVVPYDAHNSTDAKKDWVISDLKMGDADRNIKGNRVRQALTVTVMEFTTDTTLDNRSSAQKRQRARGTDKQRAAAHAGANKSPYVSKAGDTLEKIAARSHKLGGLGKSSRWTEIRKLNPKFRDPRKPLPQGTVLKMPR